METIVCATRGGEASRRTQEHAVELARERGAELVFLCVVDAGFAGPLSDRMQKALADEMRRLGRSLLCIAQERAIEQGVAARTEVRYGPVQESIEQYLQEVDAETLVLGASRTEAAPPVFDSQQVDQLAEKIRQDTGIEVAVVR